MGSHFCATLAARAGAVPPPQRATTYDQFSNVSPVARLSNLLAGTRTLDSSKLSTMLRLACSLRLGTISTTHSWSSPTAAAAVIASCSCLPRLAPAQLPSSATAPASALPRASTRLDPSAAPAGQHATSNSSGFQPMANLPPSLPSRCLPHLGRHPCSLQSRFTPWASSRSLHGTAVERDPHLSRLEAADVEWFRALLGDGGVVTDPARLEPHNRCGVGGWAVGRPLYSP